MQLDVWARTRGQQYYYFSGLDIRACLILSEVLVELAGPASWLAAGMRIRMGQNLICTLSLDLPTRIAAPLSTVEDPLVMLSFHFNISFLWRIDSSGSSRSTLDLIHIYDYSHNILGMPKILLC